jgi:hypothetical protein
MPLRRDVIKWLCVDGFALKKLSRIQARIEHCNFAPARLLIRKNGGLLLVLYAFAEAS